MTHMAMVYRRPVGVMRQSVKPQLASRDRAGHPSQVKLGRFLAHVDVIAGPVLATVSGRVSAELIVGFSDGAWFRIQQTFVGQAEVEIESTRGQRRQRSRSYRHPRIERNGVTPDQRRQFAAGVDGVCGG